MPVQRHSAIPHFEFRPPPGYHWLIERALVGFEPFTQLQPWHYLDATSVIDVSKLWPSGPLPDRLVAFARRQDRDDLACFKLDGERVAGVVAIHGWTTEGYAVLAQHDDFWSWVKSVVDDVAQWSEG